MHLVCIDCGQVYGALDGKNGVLKTAAAADFVPAFRATRHDRWELPRTEPIVKTEVCPYAWCSWHKKDASRCPRCGTP